MSIYTILERLHKLENNFEEATEFWTNVEGSVETILIIKEQIKTDMSELKLDIKNKMNKIELDIKTIKKTLGLN